jgi:galactokinase
MKEEEKGTTASLVKGVLSMLKKYGYAVGGFEAYITSDVPVGAGLSSSAAFETLIGTVIAGLYNNMNIDPVMIAIAGQKAENKFFGKPCGLMDQMACSVGNMVHIDFEDPKHPLIERIDFDFSRTGYSLCITDTRCSHSDLTDEYAAITEEMKEIARLLGHETLRPVTLNELLNNIADLRATAGDRAVLRAIHYITENARVAKGVKALNNNDIYAFVRTVRQSGNSSFKYLQNAYVPSDIRNQTMSVALAVSDAVLTDKECSRIHGGGFAGTIQAFVKEENTKLYKNAMDKLFGEGACQILKVRKYGGIRVL